MNIGAELPYRRSRRSRPSTGSLIFDHQLRAHTRRVGESEDDGMRIWSNGRFRAS